MHEDGNGLGCPSGCTSTAPTGRTPAHVEGLAVQAPRPVAPRLPGSGEYRYFKLYPLDYLFPRNWSCLWKTNFYTGIYVTVKLQGYGQWHKSPPLSSPFRTHLIFRLFPEGFVSSHHSGGIALLLLQHSPCSHLARTHQNAGPVGHSAERLQGTELLNEHVKHGTLAIYNHV